MQTEAGGAILPPAQADKDSRLVLEEERNKKEDPPQSGGLGGRTDGFPAETNLQEDMQVSPQKDKGGQARMVNVKPAASENKKGETATPLAQMYNTQDQHMELDETLTVRSSGPHASDNPLNATAGLKQVTQDAPTATKVAHCLEQQDYSSGGSHHNSPPGKRGPEFLPSPDGKSRPQRPRADADLRNTDLEASQAARNELSQFRQDTTSGKEAVGDDSSTPAIGKSATGSEPADLEADGQAEPPKTPETGQAPQQADGNEGHEQDPERKTQAQALEQEQKQEQGLVQGPAQSPASDSQVQGSLEERQRQVQVQEQARTQEQPIQTIPFRDGDARTLDGSNSQARSLVRGRMLQLCSCANSYT
jgi:hypothetical protein